MNMNCRIVDPNIDIAGAIMLLADGNPGALRVMSQLVSVSSMVDPDDFAGPFGPLIELDAIGIYGDGIWLLYKNLCGECLPQTIAVLRAVQLGIVPQQTVLNAIANVREGKPSFFDAPAAWDNVCKRLPNFQKNVFWA